MKNVEERNSNFELLRIVSILMVISLHYLNGSMGGAFSNTIKETSNYYIICFIESLCIIAVSCFVLITGYFMIDKSSVKLYKPINLILTTIFYGCVLYIISIILGIQSFSVGGFANSLIFLYDSKWFVGIYIILFILIPYLNVIPMKLDKQKYKQFVVILIIVFSIVPTILPKVTFNDTGYGVLTFLTLYFIGGYLRLYYKADKNKMLYLAIYVLCTLITTILVLAKPEWNVWWKNGIVNLISSISLFLFFSKLNFRSRIVNYLSTFSFAVYIIHSDASIRVFLYRSIFKSEQYWNNPLLLINMAKTLIGIYFGCILIEIIRRLIIKPISNKIKIGDQLKISV